LFANNQYTDYEDTHALDKMGKKLLAKWWEVPPVPTSTHVRRPDRDQERQRGPAPVEWRSIIRQKRSPSTRGT
jgi:hypothetical protein